MYGQGAKNKHPIYDDKTINIVNDMYKHFHNDVGKLLFMYFQHYLVLMWMGFCES
jgi:hypothetical protein